MNKEFWIRKHHLWKVEAVSRRDPHRSPDELADEWISYLQKNPRWNAYYQFAAHPEIAEAMRKGFAQHIRHVRAGNTPRFAENKNVWRDPVCAKCISERCGDSRVYRKDEFLIPLSGLYELLNMCINLLHKVSTHK